MIMTMTLNEILTKQSVLNSVLIKSGDSELSKELKVKIVRLRIAFNRVKQQFDSEVQEFTKNLIPEEFTKIQSIPESERTLEQVTKLEEMVSKINSEYTEFLEQKGKENISFTPDTSFTEDEFNEIVAVNAGCTVLINDKSVQAEDMLEGFYTLFVENKK